MKILDALRERRRRREHADQMLVAARLEERAEPSSLSEDAERVRLESRRNTPIIPR